MNKRVNDLPYNTYKQHKQSANLNTFRTKQVSNAKSPDKACPAERQPAIHVQAVRNSDGRSPYASLTAQCRLFKFYFYFFI